MMTRSSLRPKTGVAGRHLVGLAAGIAVGAGSGAVVGNALIGPLGAIAGGMLCAIVGALLGHATAEAMWPTMGDLYSMRTTSRIESRAPSPASRRFAPPGGPETPLAPSDARFPARSHYSKETR